MGVPPAAQHAATQQRTHCMRGYTATQLLHLCGNLYVSLGLVTGRVTSSVFKVGQDNLDDGFHLIRPQTTVPNSSNMCNDILQ